MRIRTQRRLANSAGILLVLFGIALVAWILFLPLGSPNPARTRKPSPVEPLPAPTINDLTGVLNRKLQGPLVPLPTKVTERAVPTVSKVVQWPAITLDCIIASKKSKVAVFSIGAESFQCELGDEFQNVSVKDISTKSVDLVFRGQSRTMRIDEASDLSGGSQ